MKCRVAGLYTFSVVIQERDDDEIWLLTNGSTKGSIEWTRGLGVAFMINGTRNAQNHIRSLGLEESPTDLPPNVMSKFSIMQSMMIDVEYALWRVLDSDVNVTHAGEARRILEL